jgi:hemolysin activation/secretion protein
VGRFIIMPDDDVVISDNLVERISGLVLKNSPPGSPVDLNNFENVAILLSDLQGIIPIPSIKAGDLPGTTDLVLKISKKPIFRGVVITDNAGLDLNFKKLSTQFSLSSLFNRGELISAFTSINEGSIYGRLGLTTPITLGREWNGTMLDINTTRLQYQTISSNINLGGLEPPSGKSNSIGGEITHPLHRSLNANLWISGGYLIRESADKDRNIYDTDTKITTGKVYSLGINGNYFDAFLMGGVNQFSLKLLQGDSQYLGNQSTVETSNQDGAAGHFRKTVISLARQQLFVNSWSLTTLVSAQDASKNLESAEKFTLGGSGGVRAFPGSEGSGSRGFMLKNDLTKSFTDDLQASLFYDWGWVQRYIIRQGPQGQKLPLYDNEDNTGSLSGYGFNVVYNPFKDFNLNITLARRTKANPFALKNDPERNGKDTDGTLIMNRWWITMNYKF